MLHRDVPFNCIFFGANSVYRWGLHGFSSSTWAREHGASLSLGSEAFLAVRLDVSMWIFMAHIAASLLSLFMGHVFSLALQGGLAGVTGWTAVFPFDTVKSVIQTGVLPSETPAAGSSAAPVRAKEEGLKPPPSFSTALRAVLKHGGVRRGLYRGLSAAVLRAFPANAALFWGVHTAETVWGSLLLPSE